MISLPSGTLIWIVAGFTDLRRGFDGLCAMVQNELKENPFSGQAYIFRGKRGKYVSFCMSPFKSWECEDLFRLIINDLSWTTLSHTSHAYLDRFRFKRGHRNLPGRSTAVQIGLVPA